MVEPRPGLHDGGGVGDHTDGPLSRRHVSIRDDCRGLVVDAHLLGGRKCLEGERKTPKIAQLINHAASKNNHRVAVKC
ncbi:hypothetical protein E2C01_004465 [Portunus trituberculatus]|uniref:Uncharacterized protein n=1 Tax=Portunus trituberculatus TaxID=210409 RepID=A0A5B7CSF2_PORTR|nr:hypothetical protein [Portunus trituberculatus]